MDPIIATGLINLGSNIVNKAFSNSAELNPSPAVDFKDDLAKFSHEPTAKPKDLNQIREDILSFPEVQNFISKNEGNEISIDKMSDGSTLSLFQWWLHDFTFRPPVFSFVR